MIDRNATILLLAPPRVEGSRARRKRASLRSFTRRCRRATVLSPGEALLLLEALSCLVLTRIQLLLHPNARDESSARYDVRAGARAVPAAEATARRVAWAVSVTRRLLPGTGCLPSALAIRMMLRRRNIPCQVRVGIVLNRQGAAGHAWIDTPWGVLDREAGPYRLTVQRRSANP